MLSDNTSSAVTYTSISFDSNGLSWGIPLVNADELADIDPYEEVAKQGQCNSMMTCHVRGRGLMLNGRLSPTAESPGYIPDSDSMEDDIDEDSIDYLDEPKDSEEDDDEDPGEDPSEEHELEDDDEDPEVSDSHDDHEPVV
ncbi:hypothetical protein Tco_1318743 [Tanacetum coccineum]